MGPATPHSTVLSADEETLILAFRRHTRLPLDDCLYALQATIPHLTRSSLHRLFQRHGISRLAHAEDTPERQRFKAYPLGYIHIDLAEVWTEEGKLYLFVAIDRVSKFAFAELHERATYRTAADFLRRLVERLPYHVHTVLTDNGVHFTALMAAGVSPRFGRCSPATNLSKPTPLTWRVPSTALNTGSRNSITPGPTAKSNA
jgi:hypothetical protein